MNDFAPAKKALGQNFLHDPNIIRKIIAAFAPQADQQLVEIGPGRGALTEHLLAVGAPLHVVEFDYALADYWQSRVEQYAQLTVHRQDALKMDFMELAAAGPLSVIGNLPYNISSQVLLRLRASAQHLIQVVAMLQLEMADRVVAVPDNKQYGRLSVMLQQRFHAEKLFKVPSGAFQPAPKVESAIIRLVPRTDDDSRVDDPLYFAELVQAAFAQRRKTLRNTLKKHATAEQLSALGISPQARAENVSVNDFIRLANALKAA